MRVNKLNVRNVETSYPIFIGNGAISLLNKQFRSSFPKTKKVAIIFDKNVPVKFKNKIKKQLKKYNIFSKEYLTNEKLKSFKNVNNLVEILIKENFNRNDCLVAVGGGIIGDFVGFVASIFKRGINFVNLPSTLLAQVDSSIGGKTGVNSQGGKNLIGSFYQPKLVISELSILRSLPKREMICGFAEILKYALIKDHKFFYWILKNSQNLLKNNNDKLLLHAITKSCKNKIYFIVNDEKESGKRMILNFGHTFAHGIEAASSFSRKINHGEAVLIGMLLATKLSVMKNKCSISTLNKIKRIYKMNNLPGNLKKYFSPNKYNKIVNFMVNDKKNEDNKISLILLRKIGKTTIPGSIKISVGEMKKIMRKIN